MTASIFSDAGFPETVLAGSRLLPGSDRPVSVFIVAAVAASLPIAPMADMASYAPSRQKASKPAAGPMAAGARAKAPWALAAVLLLLALLVAPEQPRFQEAICQRHNGVAACRVW